MSPPPPTSPRSCSRTHSAFRKGDDAEKKRIVIIGAGLSSLALVNVLQNDSKRISEIIILEAKNDIGGTWNPNQCYHNLQTHGVRAGFDLLPWDRFDSPYDHAHHRDVHSAMKNFFQKDSIPIFSSFFVEEEESTHYKRKDDEVPSSPPSLPSKPLGSHNDEKKNVETKVYLSTRVKSMEWQKTSSSSSSRVKLNIFSDG